jgi:hypothetical protein
MRQSLNPWITNPATETAEEETPDAYSPPAAVISAPLKGMVEPDAADRLACRTMTGSAALWIIGAHRRKQNRRPPRCTRHRSLLACPPGRKQATRAAGLPRRHARPHSRQKRTDPVGVRCHAES